ncbi:AI-2E family transporter [Candidatus Pacearchaeota archaeon]|nr:hypothetical protein [uncultured archaeon]AQS33242.1 hypothetical protein [uncultured archaeon]MBS3091537.1 AI-2E family transporter [Candidatus Pacearchaeota archaeon]
MVFEKKEVSRFLTIAVIIIVGILVFFLLKPVFVSVFSGLILAYLLLPVYKRLLRVFKSRNATAWVVLMLLIIVIVSLLWFVIPILVNQFFGLFKLSQTLNIDGFIKGLFPTASDAFIVQATTTVNTIFGKASAVALNTLVNTLIELPNILLHLFIVGFVFFFGLRDSNKLLELMRELSPLNKSKEKLLVQQFKDITDSLVYGQIIVGIVQGLLAGLGFLIFGVQNALVLTLLAIFMSIIPILGPFVVYLPVAFFMFLNGNTGLGIAYLLYNFAIVSTLDNFLRTYIVARKTKISSVVVFVGMMGGMFMFGLMGLLLGPLILAYFLIILQLYKEKELSSLFLDEESPQIQPTADKK